MKFHFLFVSAAICALGASSSQGAGIFSMPVQTMSSQQIADKLTFRNVEQTGTFAPNGVPFTCSPAQREDHFAIRCEYEVQDTERNDETAALDFLIYDNDANFAAEDSVLTASVSRMPGRWKIDDHPNTTLGGSSLRINCHQALGNPNSRAFCIAQAAPRILVVAHVPPARAISDNVNTSNASTYQDTRNAAELAALGAAHVSRSMRAE